MPPQFLKYFQPNDELKFKKIFIQIRIFLILEISFMYTSSEK